jgi:hypothetical protein
MTFVLWFKEIRFFGQIGFLISEATYRLSEKGVQTLVWQS